MTPQTPRASRRERPAKPALTRAGVVAAALRVMHAEGLERTTMRRLAAELDTGAASLYVYVRNTAELHAAMLDELLADVDLRPVTSDRDWLDRLVEVLTSYTMLLFTQPGLARSALFTRPSGPHYLALVEGLLALLEEGGVPPDRAAWGIDLLLQVPTATAAEQTTRDQTLGASDEDAALAAALRTAPMHTYPHIAALGPDLVSGADTDRLTWCLRVLATGVLHTPREQPSGP